MMDIEQLKIDECARLGITREELDKLVEAVSFFTAQTGGVFEDIYRTVTDLITPPVSAKDAAKFSEALE
jgi:hypothetical protein